MHSVTPEWQQQPLIDRMVRAIETVRERLLIAAHALETVQIPYAVVGGNAVAAWVATVGPSAVRNTPNVDILIRRSDCDRAISVLRTSGVDVFRPCHTNMRRRRMVQLLFGGEKVNEDHAWPAPDTFDSTIIDNFRVLTLDALLRMKLTSFRTVDAVHIRDLIEVGLVDQSWVSRLPPELAGRLQQLIDTPEG